MTPIYQVKIFPTLFSNRILFWEIFGCNLNGLAYEQQLQIQTIYIES